MSAEQYIRWNSDYSFGDTCGQVLLKYISYINCDMDWMAPLHRHDHTELLFVIGGQGMLRFACKQLPVSANDVVVISANTLHTECCRESSCLEYVALGVDGLELTPGVDGSVLIHLSTEQNSISECLLLMREELQSRQSGFEEICQRLLHVILLQLLREKHHDPI